MVYRGILFGICKRFERAKLVPFFAGNTPEDIEIALQEASKADYGTICPQLPSRLSSLEGREPEAAAMKEGELYLTVYTPQSVATSDPQTESSGPQWGLLPVMVWIHGGAYMTGGSEQHRYSGQRLADSGGVIVVKVSYRLGALGFLYAPEIGAVNLGIRDLELSLEWIHRYISLFGGDPQNVTLFGQSAGAQAIAALLADGDLGSDHHLHLDGSHPHSTSPQLFHKVIIQSAPFGIVRTEAQGRKLAAAFRTALGKDLFTASVDEILAAQDAVKNTFKGMSFMPVGVDYGAKLQGVEVVVGYTKDDASPFCKNALGRLWGSAVGRLVVRYITRKTFIAPAEKYVQQLCQKGFVVHKYFMKWHAEGNPLGACHCIELPFLLGEEAEWRESSMLKGMREGEFERGSEVFLKAWTDFAHGRNSFSKIAEL